MKKRLPFILGFITLTAVEFFIGLFIHDRFIRPYVGDVIIIWVLFCFIRIISPDKPNTFVLSACITVFAFGVEFLQKIHIVDILGVENPFLRTLIGTSYAAEDLLCYLIGSAIICACALVKNIINR